MRMLFHPPCFVQTDDRMTDETKDRENQAKDRTALGLVKALIREFEERSITLAADHAHDKREVGGQHRYK